MQRLFFIVIAGILMSGCASEKKKQELERVSNIAYTTITDSIYSSMPGKITALNGRVYWHDVTEADNFIHVVDASSGKEVSVLVIWVMARMTLQCRFLQFLQRVFI